MESNVTLEHTKDDQHQEISLSNYLSLYYGEGNCPFLTSFGQIEQRIPLAIVGGTLSGRGEFWGVARSSDLNATERVIMRLNISVHYQQVWDLVACTLGAFEHENMLDHFVIDQGNAYNRHNTTSTHSNALTLRWPLIGRSKTGAYFVEPIYQIASVRISKDIAVPAEESAHAEFNQGDLLALSRLPAPDLIETGQRRAASVNYNYRGIIGHELGQSLGRREREKQPSDFSLASGLAGAKSDLFFESKDRNTLWSEFLNTHAFG